MKFISWIIASKEVKKKFGHDFLFSPYFSLRSYGQPMNDNQSPILQFINYLALTISSLVLAHYFLNPDNYFHIILFSPIIYFFTETLGALGQMIFYKHQTFAIHLHPLSSRGLNHFWGKNWNLWVQDWLRDVSRTFGRYGHGHRLLIAFIFSGLFHEVLCNLPYWLVYRKSYFGTMMLYFLIQAGALWLDKKLVRKWSLLARRIYLWCAVILPSPLFINVPLLTFLGLMNG